MSRGHVSPKFGSVTDETVTYSLGKFVTPDTKRVYTEPELSQFMRG